MKPKRRYFTIPSLFSHPLHYGTRLFTSCVVLASGFTAQAGDILRGGVSTSGTPSGSPVAGGGAVTPSATDVARANAQDALARTNHALDAVRNLQNAARNAALTANQASENPLQPGTVLPVVPNGLGAGALQIAPGAETNAALWSGANLPTQVQQANGTTVTVKQTTQQALLTWQTMNVGKDTTLQFDQSAGGASVSQWIAFNKINDPSQLPTQILGSIKADGQVYVINQNGIIFGGASQVNARSFTASALPINGNLIQRGLINNPDAQFLFSGLKINAGANGTPEFVPEAATAANGKYGDVTVQAGARITTSVAADGSGGRIALVGANVSNAGTLSSRAGQVILAGGLQVGFAAHASSDPGLRGLDVYVGAVVDPLSVVTPYAGSVANAGIIDVARGSAWLAGKSVNQLGVIDSTTSVSLNGRIDLTAQYNAVPTVTNVDAAASPFSFQSTGAVTLGEQSVTRILPEIESTAKTIGSQLALRSQINIQGRTVQLAPSSHILAPNAIVNLRAGEWVYQPNLAKSTFVHSAGQVHIGRDALIHVAGTTSATASAAQNLLALELRGNELAPVALQRDGELRGETITVDVSDRGNFEGRDWVGTPLADVSGYVGLIERTVAQLTTAGGEVNIAAGASVVVQEGAKIDVSGGYTDYQGAVIETTRVISNGKIVDIAQARPDEVFDGIYQGGSTYVSSKWGVEENFVSAIGPTGRRYQEAYTQGADAGSIVIQTPSIALAGGILGNVVVGSKQWRGEPTSSALPLAGSFSLSIRAQSKDLTGFPVIYPQAPVITWGPSTPIAAPDFSVDANGNPIELDAARKTAIALSPTLLSERGFSRINVRNETGSIVVADGVKLNTSVGGSVSFTASNIDVQGGITAAGGSITITALNQSPFDVAVRTPDAPVPAALANRGQFTLGSHGVLSTAGTLTDDRLATSTNLLAADAHGGSIRVTAYDANIANGSLVDVSGGYAMTSNGTGIFGNAGSISIQAGQDGNLASVVGGHLTLAGSLRGLSGAKAGALSIQVPQLQIGGVAPSSDVFLLGSEFFSQGGFGSFTLTGLGVPSNNQAAAVRVAAQTVIRPIASRYRLIQNPANQVGFVLEEVVDVEGLRNPVNISLNAPGISENGGLYARGNVVVEEGALIHSDAKASLSVSGNTVTILGSLITAGGSIKIAGSSNSTNLFGDVTQALTTTYLGCHSLLSTQGTTLLTADPYGRKTGSVIGGGQIQIQGNIAAAAGSVWDVSGYADTLDIPVARTSPAADLEYASNSGINQSPQSLEVVRTRVESHAGSIVLQGGQMLYSDATMLGHAGGDSARGGSFTISSGQFQPPGSTPLPTDASIEIVQSGRTWGSTLPDDAGAIGLHLVGSGATPSAGRGMLAVQPFADGGFDALSVSGVAKFSGPVSITAGEQIVIGQGGLLYADAAVTLNAPYVSLGMSYASPLPASEQQSPFTLNGLPYAVAPVYGAGQLHVEADLIDVGNLSLRGIGTTNLFAESGEIRGHGTLSMAGNLTVRAGQLYPVTASDFSLFAYDYNNGSQQRGSIVIEGGASRKLPLSAAGNLALYASSIQHSGVLRAPFGTITLGWDGSGTAPLDVLTRSALTVPITSQVTLASGSITSVSAVDPQTGKGLILPYGVSVDGTHWIDPRGVDITTAGIPEKRIRIAGAIIDTAAGSTIDVRGGGDLYAYRWVPGLGGPSDILAAANRFAILPDYDSSFAAQSAYNTTSTESQLDATYPGYISSSLQVGDRVYLNGSKTLAAGYYTLLPPRYALLPNAILLSTSTNQGIGTLEKADKSSIVSGYRFNSLDQNRLESTLTSRFEVAKSSVFRKRAQYDDFLANRFFTASSALLGGAALPLPKDSGSLVLQAAQGLQLTGSVLSASIAGGRGSAIDISSAQNIWVTSGNVSVPSGSIALQAAALNALGAESLLIGGYRNGNALVATSQQVVLQNASTALTGGEIILASKSQLTLADESKITTTGTRTSSSAYTVTGAGAVVHVSQDAGATVTRSSITTPNTAQLLIGENVSLQGNSLVLDSSAAMNVADTADLDASLYHVQSGQMSVVLDANAPLQPSSGLILAGDLLANLQAAKSLSLQSYASIDFYGAGEIGSSQLKQLSLNAGSIRGFNQSNAVTTLTADSIWLGNSQGVAAATPVTPLSGTFSLRAKDLVLAPQSLQVSQFAQTNLFASRSVTGEGTGVFSVQGALTVDTPVITGAAGAVRSILAGQQVVLTDSSQGSGSLASAGLGSSLSISGSSVTVESKVLMPSGLIDLTATSGNLVLRGELDVSGTRQTFNEVQKYTDAGQIKLNAAVGNILLDQGSRVSVAAHSQGGNAGFLSIATPQGSVSFAGELLGGAHSSARTAGFSLDVAQLTALSPLSTILNQASIADQIGIRVRTGNVLVDGNTKARSFVLSADDGNISVTGKVDVSGVTAGSIRLAARGDVSLLSGAVLDASAQQFTSAGKGGDVVLEAGAQRNGVVGTGSISIGAGSLIDLAVDAKIAGDATVLGSSASFGQFSGKLHLRAPQISGFTDVDVKAIAGSVVDASSILVEGYRVYDLTSSAGQITSTVRTTIHNDARNFLGAATTVNTNATNISNRLLSVDPSLASVLVLAPGVEIINRTGDLTLGSASTSVANDWDLSSYRYGEKSAPGVLTLRAAGSLNFFSALSDAFTVTATATNAATRLWLARPTVQNALLPVNEQSWSYRLVAGADQTASDFSQLQATSALSVDAGMLRLGNNRTNVATSFGGNATTSSAIAATTNGTTNGYQVIRTGSGDIEIHAARSVQLLNQFATIYTAGTRVLNPTWDGRFDLPSLSQVGIDSSLGAVQQSNPAAYTMAGGNVSIFAGGNIERLTRNASNQLVADSQLQLPNNWLYRRGYVDPATGTFGTNRWGESASTTWFIDFTNFFQGVGALAGGNVTMVAGQNISNVDAVIPTNARSTGYTDTTRTQKVAPQNAQYVEIGGGDLEVRATGNIDAGVYYIERGHGTLKAGGSILTNATRSVISSGQASVYTQLPTTLFLGKGGFDVSANRDVLLGPVANPFLLPGGLNNSFWQKSYFSTYAPESYVNATSLGGDVTWRTEATAPGQTQGVASSLLHSWVTNKQWLSDLSASNNKPWLRLSESSTLPFQKIVALAPANLSGVSFSGDVNLVGDLTLSPAARGNVELLARDSINALQKNGVTTINGRSTTTWGTSTINLSDANPAALPGITNPFAYHLIAGDNASAASTTNTEIKFLSFIDRLFEESGSVNQVLETKQALHSNGLLHLHDDTPLRIYAANGDISGLVLYSPKATQIVAGRDIQDISFYLQHNRDTDDSFVSAGRDIVLSSTNSASRVAATASGNVVNFDSSALAGDVQIGGKGTLQVLAGRDLDLGIVGGNADGTGVGITSIGNSRNPYLPFDGANLVVGAGLTLPSSLADSVLNWDAFIAQYVLTEQGRKYLEQIAPDVTFSAADEQEQARLALEVFYQILRDAGRNHAKTGDYKTAEDAIALLFGTAQYEGNVNARSRDIRTANGGNISVIAPGGGLELASTTTGNPLSPPGIITSSGGAISIFAHKDISIGIGRIFTLRGGNEIIWSTKGDIAAGSSSKTVQSAPPTRVLIDPQSASVQTDLAGLATGGGIGVLATVAGVKPGDVDLIAPEGSIDAGDAGIRVSGNLNISASQVLNAGNIAVAGNSAGTPAPAAPAASISAVTNAANAAATTATRTTENPRDEQPNRVEQEIDVASIFTVEVLGYGGGDGEEEEEEQEPTPEKSE